MKINMRSRLLLLVISAVVLLSSFASAAQVKAGKTSRVVYVGTYTERGSKGIYAYNFNEKTGAMTPLGLMGESVQPSFVAIDAAGRHLYAVNETDEFNGKPTGGVSAFAIDPATHKLKLLNQVESGGKGPAHLSLDNSGKYVMVANYNGGSIETVTIKPDGSLGDVVSAIEQKDDASAEKPRVSHAHHIKASPDNRFVVVNNLGLDRVYVYKFDVAKGTLSPNDPPFVTTEPGAGPRHFKFHPNGKFAFTTNELNSSVTAYAYDAAKGVLTPLQTVSTKPDGFTAKNDSSELVVHPSGRFLYAANRGVDAISVFTIDQRKGTLTLVERGPSGGKTPRNFNVDPTGRWLIAANMDSDDMVVFRINQATGKLTPTGKSIPLSAPVCIVFLPEK